MEEEIIDIESFSSTVIDVPEVVSDSVVDHEMEMDPPASVLNLPKRIIIGVSLLILLIVPVGGGAYISYLMRKDLHNPVDKYNIWPDTAYKGFLAHMDESESEEYSVKPNHFYPIKDEDGTQVFELKYGYYPEVTRYMKMYLIENIVGEDDLFGLCVVCGKTDKDLEPTYLQPEKVNGSDEIIIKDKRMTKRIDAIDYGYKQFGSQSFSSLIHHQQSNSIFNELVSARGLDFTTHLIYDSNFKFSEPRVESYTIPENVNSKLNLDRDSFLSELIEKRKAARKAAEATKLKDAMDAKSAKLNKDQPTFTGIPHLSCSC